MQRKQWLLLIVALVVFGRIGLGMRVSAQQAVTVTMKDFEFQPKTLTIAAGSTVTWVNSGTKKHSATADDGSFDTGLLARGRATAPPPTTRASISGCLDRNNPRRSSSINRAPMPTTVRYTGDQAVMACQPRLPWFHKRS